MQSCRRPNAIYRAPGLIRAARLFENPGLSVARVANHLDYSSPQSFGRHVRTVMRMSPVSLVTTYDGQGMLQCLQTGSRTSLASVCSRHFGRRRHILAGSQNPSPENESTLSVSRYIFEEAIGRTIAHWYPCDTYSRKVRAPVDRLPGNTWARTARAVRDGKCHREETAIFGWQG